MFQLHTVTTPDTVAGVAAASGGDNCETGGEWQAVNATKLVFHNGTNYLTAGGIIYFPTGIKLSEF